MPSTSPSDREPVIPRISERQKNTPPQRRRFIRQFKDDVVRLVVEHGYTQQAAADAVGVSSKTVGGWVRAARPDVAKHPVADNASAADLAAENRELRRRLARAEMEADILKKATAYFAKDSL